MLQITVDLSTSDPAGLVRLAEFILRFAGFEPQQVGTQASAQGQKQVSAADDLIERGKAITRGDVELKDATVDPQQAFGAAGGALLGGDPQQAAFGAATPPAPPVPPVPPAPPAAGIDVDARGLPWDPRIHSSTRAKTQDGQWRQKRGVDPNLLQVVEAELRQTMGAAPVPPVPTAGSVAPPAPPVSGTPTGQASAGAATGASPGSQGLPGVAPTFPQLMSAITKGFTANPPTITREQVDAAMQKVGLPALPMLASRVDLVGAVATELGIAL